MLGHTDAAGNWALIKTALQASAASTVRARERDHAGASNHHTGVKLRDKEKHLAVTAQRRAERQRPEDGARRHAATSRMAQMQDAARDFKRYDDLLRGLPTDGAS